MVKPVPLFLTTEVPYAFRQCTQWRQRFQALPLDYYRVRQFGACRISKSFKAHQNRAHDIASSKAGAARDVRSITKTTLTKPTSSPAPRQQSRELVPQNKDGRTLGARRTVDAPMKIIPKASITPNLKLSPQERLHVEVLTRRAPPMIKQPKIFKERLFVYHHGNKTEVALIFLKVFGLVCAGAVTLIVVPAHYMAGTPLWLCGIFFLAGWFPSIFFHRLLKPLVTAIHLQLPPSARTSPEAAMEYAKNLPASAQLDVSFMRITALPGTVTVSMSALQPIPQKSRWPWQCANLRWVGDHVDKGTRFKPNPTDLFVKPIVGAGKAQRDVIPGIWPEIYNRLTGVTQTPVSKWRKASL